ncbi:DNA-directed DNA polymerase [Sporothrix stenoceras]|uniref:DNA-directed DNA polymerase n=1 Tax=Sporothrix stenoceras TaxID=5173 RepID=A0ABR3YQ09_9PEZI
MGKRKRSGKANGQQNGGNNNNNKRARIVDVDDSDAENQQTTGVLPVTFAPGESPEEKETLLSNKTLFASDLSRADHDRERRLYKLLGSADVEDRIRAADVIVSALLGSGSSESVSESVLLRHLERRLLRGLASGSEASRVGFSYVLSELLGQLFGRKGEAKSSDKVDYASTYPNLTFDKLLDLLLEKTKPAANLPGQEERDHYWGLLFGLQSFVESGILFGPGDNGRVSFWDSLLERLLQLGHKKVWLRSQACFVVVQAIARGRLPDEATVAATLQTVASDTNGDSLAKTPEGLGMWLAALARFPEMALPAPWTSPLAPGSHKDVVAVLKNSGSGDDEAGPKTKQGNASAQLPFVWDLLLNELLVGGAAKRFDAFWVAVVDQVYFAKGASDHQKLTGFKVFQKALALCTAMADKATDASEIEEAIRPSLFSNNLMACLMNQASNPTPRLHRAAVQVLKVIERQVEENPRILALVLACLLGSAPQSHGVYEFDERVKGTGDGTRPVEKILRFADSESIDEVVRLLRMGALQAPDANSDQKPFRIYAEYLFRLVSRAGAETAASAQTGEASVSSIAFQALAELAYPTVGSVVAVTTETNGDKKKKKSKSAAPAPVADAFQELNEKTLAAARKSLLSAAGALLKRPDDFASFCRTVRAIEPESVGVDMTGEIKECVLAARKQLQQLLAAFDVAPTKSSKKNGDAAAASRARQGLAVLLAVSLLQLYHEPRADAIEVLDDIQACGDKLTAALARSGKKEEPKEKKGKKAKKSKKAEVDSDEDDDDHEHGEPDIGQVLTEVLLALLAESSQLTRQTSLQVFEAFTPFMSAEALDNLTDVLAAEENTSGYRTLFNQEGEDEEEDSGDEDGEDDDDDDDDNSVVMMDMDADGDVTALAEGVKSSDDEDSGDSDDSEESDSDEEEADEEEDDKKAKAKGKKGDDAADDSLEAALRKTYGKHLLEEGDDADKKEEEDDDDSDNESDMSDEAMLRLDDHLAGHLALIRNKTDSHKKERDEARKRVVGFKHRVLDLVETYVKKAPSDNSANLLLLFRLLLPLVVLIRDTKEPALSQKAARIVQEVPKQLKKGRSSTTDVSVSVDLDDAAAILEELHVAANDKTESRAFAAAVSTASLAIASTLWAATAAGSDERAAAYQRVADVYRSTQDRWVLDGWSVRTSLFTDWYNWCQNAARGQ